MFQSCVCMCTTPETIETFSENARCLDDASSAEIILLIQRVCITFFRISTQKALRATLLRGCFLVILNEDGYLKTRLRGGVVKGFLDTLATGLVRWAQKRRIRIFMGILRWRKKSGRIRAFHLGERATYIFRNRSKP